MLADARLHPRADKVQRLIETCDYLSLWRTHLMHNRLPGHFEFGRQCLASPGIISQQLGLSCCWRAHLYWLLDCRRRRRRERWTIDLRASSFLAGLASFHD